MTEEKTFPPVLNHTETVLALFDNLRKVAGDEPKRLATFYSQSSTVREAAEKLQECELELKYNLEWFGRKRLGPVASRFEQAWAEYQDQWAPAIAYGSFCETLGERSASHAAEFRELNPYNPDLGRNLYLMRRPEQEKLDPDRDEFLDPVRHDGGDALALGVDHWRGEVRRAKLIANKCQIALDAFDHLRELIGIDIADIFRRWREVPRVLMPPAVSEKHGEKKGSLNDLLDDAVRAFVCGAPTAAIAMCRAILEMVIKDHYITDPKDQLQKSGQPKTLNALIALAKDRFEFLRPLELGAIKDAADQILHRHRELSASEEKAIIEHLRTLKTLVQKVEK